MRIDNDSWLLNKPIAHRGLWGGSIKENSFSAFENAVKCNYPIEIDLFSTTDGEIVCFHDDSLFRMTGANGNIYEKSFTELSNLNIIDNGGKIPTLKQVLELTKNKVPLLIEFKNQPNKHYIDKAVEMLKNYKGEFAVQSFNPFYLARIKKLAPYFLRGILATENATEQPKYKKYILKNMSLNFLCKPDFISYSNTGLPLKKNKINNLPILAWTVTSQKRYDEIKNYCNNIIFENFIPKKQ